MRAQVGDVADAAGAHLDGRGSGSRGSARSTVSGTPISLLRLPRGGDVGAAAARGAGRGSPWCRSCPASRSAPATVGRRAGRRRAGPAGRARRPGRRRRRSGRRSAAAPSTPDGAGRHRGRREVVAVDVLAGDRHEQPAGLRRAGVDERRRRSPSRRRRRRRPAVPPTDRGDLGQRHRDHRPAACRAPRAATRGRRTGAPRRRSPGPARGPCRRPGPRRPGARTAYGLGDRGPPVADLDAPRRAPPWRRRGSPRGSRRGSSVRGLSSVTTRTSAPPGGDLAHERPLAGVAVAAGAEHDDQPALA